MSADRSYQIASGQVLAIVLGRGGSKGLPGKNLKPLGGQPLVAWAIAAGACAKSVDRLICSSDSADILAVAQRFGAETPFVRPAELAADGSTDLDVFGHALNWLADNEGSVPEYVVQLRPTTPFRDPAWIDAAIHRMQNDVTITCMRSVTPTPITPYKMWVRHGGDRLGPAMTLEGVAEPYNMPRQALPEVLWHTGQIDVIRSETILAGSMTGSQIAAIDVSIETAVDIDTAIDFQIAEAEFDRIMPVALKKWMVAHGDKQ
jgi:CMP-N,N'-diacetyllegionaminic acid synthase